MGFPLLLVMGTYVPAFSLYSSVVLRTVGLGGQHHPGLHGSRHPGNDLSLDEHTIELGTGSGRAHDRIDHQSEGGLEVLDPDLPEIPRSSEVSDTLDSRGPPDLEGMRPNIHGHKYVIPSQVSPGPGGGDHQVVGQDISPNPSAGGPALPAGLMPNPIPMELSMMRTSSRR